MKGPSDPGKNEGGVILGGWVSTWPYCGHPLSEEEETANPLVVQVALTHDITRSIRHTMSQGRS